MQIRKGYFYTIRDIILLQDLIDDPLERGDLMAVALCSAVIAVICMNTIFRRRTDMELRGVYDLLLSTEIASASISLINSVNTTALFLLSVHPVSFS